MPVSIPVEFDVAPGDLESQMSGVASRAGDTAGQGFGTRFRAVAGPLLAGVFAGLSLSAVTDFFRDAVGGASGLNESLNALRVTFGENADAVAGLGQSAATTLGLSNLEFNNLAVRFSSFASTIAGDGGDVVGTLDDLTGRAADFASVMNLDVADAAQLFQSGLAGESEPLRQFGIDLSAATVQSFAYANGIAEAGTQLTEAQRIQATYGSLMEQTAKTQGDFTNTSDQLANQQRILASRFADAQAQLGQALIPALTSLTTIGIQALDSLGGLSAWFTENQGIILTVAGIITTALLPVLIQLGVQAALSAARQAAAWVVASAGAIASAAASYAASVRVVAGWVLMGVQSLIQAARVAAAWLIAIGPIGLVIAAVVGLVVLIVANWDKIKAVTERVWKTITTFVSTRTAAIRDTVSRAFTAAANTVGSIMSAIGNGVRNGFNTVVAIIRNLPSVILSALSGLARMGLNAGRSIVNGIANGIRNAIGNVTSAISGVLSTIRDFLPFSPAKTGPFSGKGWSGFSGEAIMRDLAAGVKRAGPIAVEGTADVMGRVSSAIAPTATAAGAPATAGSTVILNEYGPQTWAGKRREVEWAQKYSTALRTFQDGAVAIA